jgi:hypothetical protein
MARRPRPSRPAQLATGTKIPVRRRPAARIARKHGRNRPAMGAAPGLWGMSAGSPHTALFRSYADHPKGKL